MLHAVVMAGGMGTRFWPQSRRATPKQLLRLGSENTLLQETVARVSSWIPGERTWIVTSRQLAAATAGQLPELPESRILMEPCGRNTAPCIGLAAVHLLKQDPEAIMLLMPADHVIQPHAAFRSSVESAVSIVKNDPRSLVLFGVTPSFPSTGYGYIERGDSLVDLAGAFRVASFREKPDVATAQKYITAGSYYWNCGIFVWRAQTVLDALGEFEPEMHARLLKVQQSIGTADYEQTLAEEFPKMNAISIDFSVLEKASEVCVVEASFAWDDVGSWQALPRLLGTDAEGNTIDGEHCGVDTRDCIIRSTDGHLVATIGMENCIVVHTPDATLVARKDDEDSIRRLVSLLGERGYDRFL